MHSISHLSRQSTIHRNNRKQQSSHIISSFQRKDRYEMFFDWTYLKNEAINNHIYLHRSGITKSHD